MINVKIKTVVIIEVYGENMVQERMIKFRFVKIKWKPEHFINLLNLLNDLVKNYNVYYMTINRVRTKGPQLLDINFYVEELPTENEIHEMYKAVIDYLTSIELSPRTLVKIKTSTIERSNLVDENELEHEYEDDNE